MYDLSDQGKLGPIITKSSPPSPVGLNTPPLFPPLLRRHPTTLPNKTLSPPHLTSVTPPRLIVTRMESNDSNALIMPGKKRKAKDGKNLHARGAAEVRMSKSQKRKLKKLEEEKWKSSLLEKTMEMLEKYKIPDDAYSLLQSSQKVGRAETKRKKCQKAVQISEPGHSIPSSDEIAECVDDGGGGESQGELTKQAEPMVCLLQPKNVRNGCMDSSSLVPGNVQVPANEDDVEVDNGCGDEIGKPDRLDDDPHVGFDREVNLSLLGLPMKPTVVYVSRPHEVADKRKDLPIVMMEQEIMEAINYHSVVIICGETGCGKTTQVPQFLFEAGFGSKQSPMRSGMIGVTQPRRVAVLATAKRVAYELGVCLGKEVGFQVRYDKRIGAKSSIKFMTDGILLREVQNDFLLRRYSVIILDEAHERSLNTDILIGMLSRVIRMRQEVYENQQKMLQAGQSLSDDSMIFPLKLVLMSASLRVEDFVSGERLFISPPPVLEIPTRQFPVSVHFSKKTEIIDYIGQAYKKVISIHKRLPPGGVLVFVTGQREVEHLCRKLRRASKELVSRDNEVGGRNEVPEASNSDFFWGIDVKEVDEACKFDDNTSNQQSDWFSTCDEDQYDVNDNESDITEDFESDSDWETSIEFGNYSQQTPGNSEDPAGFAGKEETLASLKAAFEALERNRPLKMEDEKKNLVEDGVKTNEKHTNGGKRREKGIGVSAGPMHVLPLYAMLPAAAQLLIFAEVKEGERLVVVATNVAETSLTIPGIKYVVDTGREKVKNYNSSNGMETYNIQWISKASAAQRAGRAGRTGPGHCYRLYSSAVFNDIFHDFSLAEISKVPVEGVVLLLKSMGINKVANFPFPTPPNLTSLLEAAKCLKVLEALAGDGRLTPLGKAMARYPMSPRHSRMLLTVCQIMRGVDGYARANLVLGYAVAAAASLSFPNPFILQFEGINQENRNSEVPKHYDLQNKLDEENLKKRKLKEAIKASRGKFHNPSSDALSIAFALKCFEQSENQLAYCEGNGLHLKTMEEMSKLRKQLLQLVFSHNTDWNTEREFSWTHGGLHDVEKAWEECTSKHPLQLNEERLLGQALCAGWADRVARRIRGNTVANGDGKAHSVRYQACMVKETVFLHRWSCLSKAAPEFLVYSELLHTKRPYMHGATSVDPEWLVNYGKSLCSLSAPLDDPKPYYDPSNDQVLSWVAPTFGPHLWKLPLQSIPITNEAQRVKVFAYALLEGQALPCIKHAKKSMVAPSNIILRPEARGQKRINHLLFKMESKRISCCQRLREVWEENPMELHAEIRGWFQSSFVGQFERLWSEMHAEICLEPLERFPKRARHRRKEG
ncbi:hypothetical protein MLD38_012494 [Melastoma candidum]|uniref:Uncharacterized protein n=1 Tax=Melastoma candidum TaxID=119954 RepID=A0ACB9RAP2_9MYRT|nr:hypothetical protein MLD38_012494 [Melastoma candidum]